MSSLSVIQKNLLREIMKDQDQIDLEEAQDEEMEEEDSDCEDESNDYSAGDIKKIMNAKFDPEKEKTSNGSKRRKLKEGELTHKNKEKKKEL